jgi:hypothetical protein
MKVPDFEILTDERFTDCKRLMFGPKDREYSREGDKLWNFKRAGMALGISPEEALLGMMSKHLVSILDIAADVVSGKMPSQATLDEKFSDLHNYFFLLEGLIRERSERLIVMKREPDHEER